MNLPSLRALRCFDASARHASFTRAAHEVHLTQGAVSHQILGLEAQLGVPLFLRRKSGLQLTAAGSAYWSAVSPALRQIERATQDLLTHGGHGGSLNLSVASSFGAYWLIPRLPGFVAAHPEITLNLATHVGPVDLAGSPHDAAIEFCSGAAPGLQATLVLPLVVRPFAAPGLVRHGTLKKWLRTLPLIRVASVPNGWPVWLQAAGLADAVAPDRLAAGPQYDLLSMALNGAIAGLGIALLPDYAAAGAVAAGQLQQLSPCAVTADKGYYLRYPAWKADLVAIRRFEQWLGSLDKAA
ncbi:LysR family transcriptional regulator [Aquabacterium humicola]|uniref:LysR family transcriptional regulator n=1 Tax=Aquabacterium humicola TaxID=3237377 RepID=UPI0025435931|nr:LysR family transcriptional regulator [Rubrivivax pictus]